jgi:hypothetical protein
MDNVQKANNYIYSTIVLPFSLTAQFNKDFAS